MNKLFGDMKTDEEKSAFFLSGRGYETGVIAHSIQNDVAMAYHRCSEYRKEMEALQAENERLRKDAERYRWLREHGRYSGKVLVDHADMGRVLRIEKQLDEIIDAEMQRPNT